MINFIKLFIGALEVLLGLFMAFTNALNKEMFLICFAALRKGVVSRKVLIIESVDIAKREET